MKTVKQTEWALKIGFIIILIALGFRVFGQDLRFNVPELLVVTESNTPEALCVHFEDNWQEIDTKAQTAAPLFNRFILSIEMAQNANIEYNTFLQRTNRKDTPEAAQFFKDCTRIKEQFLTILPEATFIQLTQYTKFKQ